jgi:uncharacterized protein
MYRLSAFTITAPLQESVVLKNTKTGAVVLLQTDQHRSLLEWLEDQTCPEPEFLEDLLGLNEILVKAELDEFETWTRELLDIRNNRARIFSLHVEPTIQCQLECGYCFENGVDRGTPMSDEVFENSVAWLGNYFSSHPEVQVFRLIYFGGEPLLRKDIVQKSVIAYSNLASSRGLEYMTEIVTNGELLDEDMARFLSQYNWKRVQITLDGPEEVHDSRRHGKGNRPTFRRIWENVLMLARSEYVPAVDIRLSLDHSNASHITHHTTARFHGRGRRTRPDPPEHRVHRIVFLHPHQRDGGKMAGRTGTQGMGTRSKPPIQNPRRVRFRPPVCRSGKALGGIAT